MNEDEQEAEDTSVEVDAEVKAEAEAEHEQDGVKLSSTELAQLRAASAKLAKLEAERAAADEAEAVQRGEYKDLLAKREAELQAVRDDASRAASDLRMIEAHEGYRSAESRTVVRALWGAMPESEREDTPDAQAARWAKAPAKAPVAVRSYLNVASTQLSAGTRSTSNANSGAQEQSALQWAKDNGLFVGTADKLTPERRAAFVKIHAKRKSKAG